VKKSEQTLNTGLTKVLEEGCITYNQQRKWSENESDRQTNYCELL